MGKVDAGVPVQFVPYPTGEFLHGTRADLSSGDKILPGYASNFRQTPLRHVYFTQTLDAAVWGAELATGDGPPRIYVVEPTGEYVDDPNVTDKRFPGNPTLSYRSLEPLRITGEVTDWTGHSAEKIQAMRDGLAAARQAGRATIVD
ncbi:MAG: NAD(+)--rifampin ADP-ribosyltransferase [Beutenbergiaceae bacterium]